MLILSSFSCTQWTYNKKLGLNVYVLLLIGSMRFIVVSLLLNKPQVLVKSTDVKRNKVLDFWCTKQKGILKSEKNKRFSG